MSFPGFLGFAPPQGYQQGSGSGAGSVTITGGPTLNRLSQTNLTAAARAGTTVTASATAHTVGTYASLIDPTTLVSYGVFLRMKNVAQPVTDTSMLLNLAYEDTGGGAQTIVAPNVDAGAATAQAGDQGKLHFFPVLIPTNKRVSAGAQAVIGGDTVTVAVWLAQDPPNVPDPLPTVFTSYGADTANSRGTSVTPGSGAFGTWTEIGTTSAAHTQWTLGYDPLSDVTVNTADIVVEIGAGPNVGAVTTIGTFGMSTGSAEVVSGPFPLLVYAEVPITTKVWARIAAADVEPRGIIIYGS